ALSEPDFLQLSQVQSLLDPATTLVEYHLGTERSYVWMVSEKGLVSAVLPKAEEIENEGRALHESLTERNRLAPRLGPAARSARLNDAEAGYSRAAQRLSELLLSPLPNPGTERLVIVADGVLHYVPFAALPLPKAWSAAEPEPLLTRYSVVSLPSAAVIEVLRSERNARPQAPKQLAVFADPVFDVQDGRVQGRVVARRPVAAGGPQALRASGSAADLSRLEYTRELADTLASGL